MSDILVSDIFCSDIFVVGIFWLGALCFGHFVFRPFVCFWIVCVCRFFSSGYLVFGYFVCFCLIVCGSGFLFLDIVCSDLWCFGDSVSVFVLDSVCRIVCFWIVCVADV